jgi:hypothetical protein
MYNIFFSDANIAQPITKGEWLLSGATLLLGAIALAVVFVSPWWIARYRAPKLRVGFILSPPDCHKTILRNEYGKTWPVYYFRFTVENNGATQAEECEVLLETIFRKGKSGKFSEDKNFGPTNLKWSGINRPRSATQTPTIHTIQPGRKLLCDLGRITHPTFTDISVFHKITPAQDASKKFMFELYNDPLFSQWDCLVPGSYKIVISVYSKNAKKITQEFYVSWSGKWQDTEKLMFKELVITQ